ncbi:MAG TPA: deoxyribose-phosphate aldolase [Myxococcales bacterium]|nr:deoxyribose-phosphate aldolase [Myxococcales bacterium]
MVREQLGHEPGSGHDHSPSSCSTDEGDCGGCGPCSRKIIELGAARIGANGAELDPNLLRADLAQYIDHTLHKARVSREELKKLCSEAAQYCFASVCVNAANVAFCVRQLRGSGVPVCAVVGFPLGAMTPAAKAFETKEAVRAGACEIDMVLNIGAMKSRDYALVLEDIQQVVQAAKPALVKVILETAELTHEEKVIACSLSKVAQAAFVKTSTGFGSAGATEADVALMKAVVGDELEVKASGGVRTAADVDAMIQAGATRIGASASIAIVQGKKSAVKRGGRRAAGGY